MSIVLILSIAAAQTCEVVDTLSCGDIVFDVRLSGGTDVMEGYDCPDAVAFDEGVREHVYALDIGEAPSATISLKSTVTPVVLTLLDGECSPEFCLTQDTDFYICDDAGYTIYQYFYDVWPDPYQWEFCDIQRTVVPDPDRALWVVVEPAAIDGYYTTHYTLTVSCLPPPNVVDEPGPEEDAAGCGGSSAWLLPLFPLLLRRRR